MSVAIWVVVALFFAFSSGYNGSGSLVATVISTGGIGFRRALLLAATANFVGLFLFGTAVAAVIATDLVDPAGITLAGIGAGLLAALLWSSLASFLGIPSSASHTLIGGLIGGGIAAGGLRVVEVRGLEILFLALVLVPGIAVVAGNLAMHFSLWLLSGATPRINRVFRYGQLFTSILLALSYGTSNGQRIVGIIALILFRGGVIGTFSIPTWVLVAAAAAQSLGISVGGWRVIRKVGTRFFRLRPIHGFVSQIVAAVIVLIATIFGAPVSLNQIASSAIIGTGISERLSIVHWGEVEDLVVAWFATLPLTALVAIVIYPLVHLILR
ncbi:MAG TPA: inorganic phosphate transporter [Chloroflexota bacterium]|nr:inorganic phosphate transporter [Chloroflexota bacterium]